MFDRDIIPMHPSEKFWERVEQRIDLKIVVASLPYYQQRILALHLAGYKQAAIAGFFQCSQQNISKYMAALWRHFQFFFTC